VNNRVARPFRLSLTIIALCTAMYGCGKHTAEPSEQFTGVENVTVPGELTNSATSASTKGKKALHQTHSLVKPGAAVKLKNTEPLFFAAPGVYEHSLVLVSTSQTGKMTIDLSSSEGVDIVSPVRHFEFELRADSEYQVPLTLSTNADGRFYVQLHINIEADGVAETRVIAAIVQVGNPVVKVQKATTTSSIKKADGVISLPAQESISPR